MHASDAIVRLCLFLLGCVIGYSAGRQTNAMRAWDEGYQAGRHVGKILEQERQACPGPGHDRVDSTRVTGMVAGDEGAPPDPHLR